VIRVRARTLCHDHRWIIERRSVRLNRPASKTATRTRCARSEGLATTPRAIVEPTKVINLMEPLERILAQDVAGAEEGSVGKIYAREGDSRPASTGNAATRIRRLWEDRRAGIALYL
jgi:hypothetical protein